MQPAWPKSHLINQHSQYTVQSTQYYTISLAAAIN